MWTMLNSIQTREPAEATRKVETLLYVASSNLCKLRYLLKASLTHKTYIQFNKRETVELLYLSQVLLNLHLLNHKLEKTTNSTKKLNLHQLITSYNLFDFIRNSSQWQLTSQVMKVLDLSHLQVYWLSHRALICSPVLKFEITIQAKA